MIKQLTVAITICSALAGCTHYDESNKARAITYYGMVDNDTKTTTMPFINFFSMESEFPDAKVVSLYKGGKTFLFGDIKGCFAVLTVTIPRIDTLSFSQTRSASCNNEQPSSFQSMGMLGNIEYK